MESVLGNAAVGGVADLPVGADTVAEFLVTTFLLLLGRRRIQSRLLTAAQL